MATAIRDDNPVVYLHNYLLTLEHGEVPGRRVPRAVRSGRDPPRGRRRHDRRDGVVRRPRARTRPSSWPTEGVQAEVIDPRTLAPLDTKTILESVEKTGPPRRRRPGDAARVRGDA